MKALNITICGLSAHWLLSHNAAVLDSMDQNYNCYTVSCSSPSVFNDRTLGKCCVALLWHKSIDQYIQTLHIDSHRLIIIKLCLPRLNIVVIQVYMPPVNHSIQPFKDVQIQLPSTRKKASLLLWVILTFNTAPVTSIPVWGLDKTTPELCKHPWPDSYYRRANMQRSSLYMYTVHWRKSYPHWPCPHRWLRWVVSPALFCIRRCPIERLTSPSCKL